MSNPTNFSDFKPGNRFKVVDNDGRPFNGQLGAYDVVTKLHTDTGHIEGDKFIAHYSNCRLIQAPPAAFSRIPKWVTQQECPGTCQNGPEGDEFFKPKF